MPQPPRNGGLNDLRPSEKNVFRRPFGRFKRKFLYCRRFAILPFGFCLHGNGGIVMFHRNVRRLIGLHVFRHPMRRGFGAAVRHGFAAIRSLSLPCRRPFPDRPVPWRCSWLRIERGRRVPVPSVRARLLRGSRCRESRFPDVCAAAQGCLRR